MAKIRRELVDFANQPNMIGPYEDELDFTLNGQERTLSVAFYPGRQPDASYPGLMDLNTLEVQEYTDGVNPIRLHPDIFNTLFTTKSAKVDRIDAVVVHERFLQDRLGDGWIHAEGVYILTRTALKRARLTRANLLSVGLTRTTSLPSHLTHKISGFLLENGDRRGGRKRTRRTKKRYAK